MIKIVVSVKNRLEETTPDLTKVADIVREALRVEDLFSGYSYSEVPRFGKGYSIVFEVKTDKDVKF